MGLRELVDDLCCYVRCVFACMPVFAPAVCVRAAVRVPVCALAAGLPRSPFSFLTLMCAGVCRAWRDLITNDGKLWDQCVGMCGVSTTVRAKFWSWLTGAAGKGVPAWRCGDILLHCIVTVMDGILTS